MARNKNREKDIEIRYKKISKENSVQQSFEENSLPEEELRNQILQNYWKWLRASAIVSAVISVFILIAILSFSPLDEFVSDFSLKDYFDAFLGKQEAITKLQQVSNVLGSVGATISNFFVNKTIGYFSVVFPILILVWSVKILVTQRFLGKLINWSIVLLLLSFCLSAFVGSLNLLFNISIPFCWIGAVGVFLSSVAGNFLGKFGSFFLFLALLFLIVIFSFDIKIEKFFLSFSNHLKTLSKRKSSEENKIDASKSQQDEILVDNSKNIQNTSDEADDLETAQILIKSFKEENNIPHSLDNEQSYDEISQSISDFPLETSESKKQEDFQHIQETPKLIITVEENEEEEKQPNEVLNNAFTPISTLNLDEKINYTPPPVDLLIDDESKFQINEEELKQNARLLQEKLETFKIYIENLTVIPGPVVTQYEFVPAPGIKISRIQSLADDIALGLKAKGIRIIAPVPGKGTVGIEIPNKKPLVVRFGNCLKNARINPSFQLPIILGKTISGEVYVDDLARMPHLLIAGATGSGKSVGINTIIASLIYKMHPQNLKFVIIDPKKVELTHYQQLLQHFLAVSPEIEDAVVTEPTDAVLVLKALVAEMQSRYDILASVHQKNIMEYNKKVKEGMFRNDTEFIHRPMPYIVTIIDELADLMLTAGKEIESLIIRLAQLARAVGIHLVVATQRPSVDIITGLIKANFPARIAYLVASRVDSRTIIDTIGAEQLLGNGDMLFLPSGWPSPIRIQNAFLTTEEIEKICDFIANQKGFSKPYYLPKVEDGKSSKEAFEKEGFDPLFEDAARLIIRYQQASVSMLQRRLKIGYNRAGRIMDELELAGIVGPFDGSKGRTIKIATEDELDKYLREKGL